MNDERRNEGCCASCRSVKEECACRMFLFEEEKPELFVTPQWSCIGQRAFLAYRLTVVPIILTFTLVEFLYVYVYVYGKDHGSWFLYATNWNVIILLVSSIVQATNVLVDRTAIKRGWVNEMPFSWRHKLQWFLQEFGAPCSLVVSVGYWSVIILHAEDAFMLDNVSRTKHCLNSVYALIDLWVCAYPVRLLHGVYIVVGGIIYCVFEVIIFDGAKLTVLVGDESQHFLYYVQNYYDYPGWASAVGVGVLLLAYVAHVVVWLMAKLRQSLARKCNEGRMSTTDEENNERERLHGKNGSYMSMDEEKVY